MEELRHELVGDVVAIFAGVIPGGKLFTRSAKAAVFSLFKSEKPNKIQRIANAVFDDLYNSVGKDARNPGAAKSAAYELQDTIRKAKLTPEILVDCCVDPDLLFKYMERFPAEGMDIASGVRQRLYHNGLKAFCNSLTRHAMELPNMQRLVLRRILLQHRLILDALQTKKPQS